MVRKVIIVSGLLATLAVVLLVVVWLIKADVFSSGPVNGSLPPQITHVMPADGEQVGDVFGFCVHFDYQGGNGMGDEPQKSVRYYLDGRNAAVKLQ